VGIGDGARRMGHWVVRIGLTGSDRLVCMGEGWPLTGRRISDAGAVGSGPNLSRMLCSNCRVASPSLLMSSNCRSRARTRSGSAAGGSSIISFGDIGAEWNSRLAVERGFSEVASAEAEESDGSPKRPMVTAEAEESDGSPKWPMVTAEFKRTGSL